MSSCPDFWIVVQSLPRYALGWYLEEQSWTDGVALNHNGSNVRWFARLRGRLRRIAPPETGSGLAAGSRPAVSADFEGWQSFGFRGPGKPPVQRRERNPQTDRNLEIRCVVRRQSVGTRKTGRVLEGSAEVHWVHNNWLVERTGHVPRQVDGLFDGELLLALQTVAQRLALHVGHHVVRGRRGRAPLGHGNAR